MVPIQPDWAWEDLQRRMAENPPQPKKVKGAAKGASIKYWVKGLNTYVNV